MNLAFNKLQWLIFPKTKPNQTNPNHSSLPDLSANRNKNSFVKVLNTGRLSGYYNNKLYTKWDWCGQRVINLINLII